MIELPKAAAVPVVRTDFSDDAVWVMVNDGAAGSVRSGEREVAPADAGRAG
ncbi:MAG: hypothetical protein QOC66_1287, partial [Pseudonocardiales bacterium]|nr:hypothetical protein [Pseudonocardiales bacterium]